MGEKLVLVTGATGRQGGATARQLMDRGWKVRGLTRNPNSSAAQQLKQIGVEVVQGDLENIDSLRSAMQGVYGVFSVQNFWEKGIGFSGELRQGKNLVAAAKEANVQHFVQASIASCDKQDSCDHWNSKREIERMVMEAGLPFTMLRAVFYMDNFIDPQFGPEMMLRVILGCVKPDMKLHMIATEDIGALAALIFDNPELYLGKKWDVAGDALTKDEIAEVYTRITGKSAPKIGIPLFFMKMMNRDMGKQIDLNNQGIWSFPVEPIKNAYPNLHSWEDFCRSYVSPTSQAH